MNQAEEQLLACVRSYISDQANNDLNDLNSLYGSIGGNPITYLNDMNAAFGDPINHPRPYNHGLRPPNPQTNDLNSLYESIRSRPIGYLNDMNAAFGQARPFNPNPASFNYPSSVASGGSFPDDMSQFSGSAGSYYSRPFNPDPATYNYTPPAPPPYSDTGWVRDPNNPDGLWWQGKPQVDITGAPPLPYL